MLPLKAITIAGFAALWGGLAFSTAAEIAEIPPAKILFVCEHGNVKSLMAASYFNRIVQEKHLPYIAFSRGAEPDSTTVPPAIAAGLRIGGFDVSGFHPSKLTAADVNAAQRVIMIGVPLPANAGSNALPALAWDDVPPASVDFEASSASLKAHIDELIKQLNALKK
ncbi:MAG TPA: hypothetical protein VNW52_10075 [Burkholderiaceae bacterium]|nr:hypothetical protein [Burkholderiaceae bacterium]